MILITLIITIIYLILIGSFIFGFDKIATFKLEGTPTKTKFSILIPFRNEAENLPDLLKSIEALKYPKHLFEIIFVDDESDDDESDESDEDDEEDDKLEEVLETCSDHLSKSYEMAIKEAVDYEGDDYPDHTLESYMKENAALVATLAATAMEEGYSEVKDEDLTQEMYEAMLNEMKESYTKKIEEMKEAWGAGK
jgi:glycosyltransferase involved in cell wall biosynthesis